MFKLAVMMHLLIGTVLAGIGVLVITSVPALADNGMKLILPTVIAGFLIAILPSIWVAKAILALEKGKADA